MHFVERNLGSFHTAILWQTTVKFYRDSSKFLCITAAETGVVDFFITSDTSFHTGLVVT